MNNLHLKTIILFFAFLCFFQQTNAKIWRVNNNSGINADYSSPQAAHDAASPGDTIHIEASTAASYSAIVASKPLVWLGNGYFTDPTKTSYIDGIQFIAGSANSVVQGLYFNSYLYIQTNNISVTRCYIPFIYFYNTSPNLTHDFSMTQCYVAGQTSFPTSGQQPSSGYTFTNNVFMSTLSLPSNFTSVVLVHNYIHQLATTTLAFIAYNNIFFTLGSNQQICTYPINVYNNLFMYNSNSLYVGNNGNIFNSGYPPASNNVFVASENNSNDTWFALKAGSPAIGAGLGGADIGPLGGTAKYRTSGTPAIPTFSQFQFQSTPTNSLPIMISTRSNN